ncbi:MAG: conserved phage C-terminal domain-containing protein [Fusobacteriaceae bacterium]
MSYSYKMVSIEILKFDCIKDKDKILMNHYLMRKENIARAQGKLPKGQFSMSTTMVMEELGWSRSKTQRCIKEFENLHIIKPIQKGNSHKKYSVYKYLVGDTVSDTDDDIVTDTVKPSQKATLNNSDDTVTDTVSDIESENYKIKNLNKELNKKELYCRIIDYLNQKTGKNFKVTTQKTKSYINARLREGFVEEDFYKVIDTKTNQWLYNDMQKYLRPETLFSNKFEAYLNEETVSTSDTTESEEIWDIEFKF